MHWRFRVLAANNQINEGVCNMEVQWQGNSCMSWAMDRQWVLLPGRAALQAPSRPGFGRIAS